MENPCESPGPLRLREKVSAVHRFLHKNQHWKKGNITAGSWLCEGNIMFIFSRCKVTTAENNCADETEDHSNETSKHSNDSTE